jgi:hypothetical protein
MSEPIVYVDVSEIRPGKLDLVRAGMKDLAAFVESREPQLISYEFYLNQAETRMTVVAVHPDAASLERHLELGGSEFRKFGELIELAQIDVYGPLSNRSMKQLHQKAQMLGRGIVNVHRKQAGFARFKEIH